MRKQICCICWLPFEGHGNNPDPVKKRGRCCDRCHATEVVPARLQRVRDEAGRGTKGDQF